MTESEFLERFDAHIAEVKDEMRLSREQHADLRAFIRDLTRRNEIVLGEMASNLSELNDEARAHTQALLSVLDRLN